MKKIAYIFIASIFSLQMLHAQTTEEVKIDNKKTPKILFDKTTHDYGTIEKGSSGECEFIFTNTGKEPLILSNVRSSCGCTVPSWPKEPLKKKKSGTIKVKYNTNRIGAINKSITVYSNATNSPVRLKITGKVVNPTANTQTHSSAPFKEKEKTSPIIKN